MGQYWVIVNLSRKQNLEPHYYGAGAKMKEFGGDPSTLRVLFNLFCKHDWNDSRIAVVGDYTESSFSTYRAFAPVSLYDLKMTTVDSKLLNVGVDDRAAERMGFVRLAPSVEIPTTAFYVFNVDKLEKIRVSTAKSKDIPAYVATLTWLLADKSCVGSGIGDFRIAGSDLRVDGTCGRWAGDRIRVDGKNDRKYRTLDPEMFHATLTFFKRTNL